MKLSDCMSAYENSQYAQVKKWEKEEPGVVSRSAGKLMKPVTWLVEKVIPKKAIEGALIGADKLADFFTDTKDVLRDGHVKSLDELRSKDLELSDKLANEVHNWAMGSAATEGGATGFFGLVGMIVDVPTLITMCLRVIHKIGICYGYECNNEAGRQIVLNVLAAAGANSMKEKNAAIVMLRHVNVLIVQNTWKKLAESKGLCAVAITAIRALAKQLGINITKRKAAQAIPYIGAGVGAAMNAAMLNDVAWAARRTFQRMWLSENKRISAE